MRRETNAELQYWGGRPRRSSKIGARIEKEPDIGEGIEKELQGRGGRPRRGCERGAGSEAGL